ncbi:MAG: ThiF family adenylyltransferase [Archangium sp.]
MLPLGDTTTSIAIGTPKHFPAVPPEIALVVPEVGPHLESDGTICFTSKEGLVLNAADPIGIIVECVAMAASALAKARGPQRGHEFLAELGAHWRSLPRAMRIDSSVSPGATQRKIVALFRKHDLVGVADSSASFVASRLAVSGLTVRNAVYVPVDDVHAESFEPQALLSPSGLRERCGLSDPDLIVVLGISRGNLGRVLVGARLEGDRLTPLALVRRDRDYLAPRGGADDSLANFRVAVVGCGAVGGFIAMSLARAGVGRLTLVDPDTFGPENAYRHALGLARGGQSKATSIRDEILRTTPHVEVEARSERLEDLSRTAPNEFDKYNMVVCATGAPNIELDFNARNWVRVGPPVVHAWLEPLGVGRHLLVANPRAPSPRGCLACLYRREEDDAGVNRAAFAWNDGVYTRDLDGCGTQFTPFAAVDAEQLACEVTRASLRLLHAPQSASWLSSWKGDARVFKAQGFRLTTRYNLSAAALEQTEDFALIECLVCGARS